MADSMGGLRRTKMCGDITSESLGKEEVVGGFVQKIRDMGNLIFIDLRDKTGSVQLQFNDETDREVFEKAQGVRSEYVLIAKGEVKERESINKKQKNGDVELKVTELRVLAKAQTTPFEITDDTKTNEELRLKYRYLDLRRPTLQKNLILRHEIAKAAREYFYANGFTEIETPMMMKSTPEGARDYLIPSRIHNGKFYALPQSPQIYKQLLMVAGMDRYIQIARCFRDEDLRADRQPEFTQIDLEMSFVDMDDILEMTEGFIKYLFENVMHKEVALPLKRMTYAEAVSRYGSDKPDTRFSTLIHDITCTVKDIEFPVFSDAIKNGGSVRAIVARGGAKTLTRKKIDKLTEEAKGIGAKGLAYIRWDEGEPNFSFKKFLDESQKKAVLERLYMKEGDVALICADKTKTVLNVLGALRLKVADMLGIIPKDKFNFLWITEFPFFEWDDEANTWVAMHHPFTMPMEECIKYLDSEPEKVVAKCFDLVVNGTELSSGSMRITDYELQQKMFESLGMTDEEIEAKFGFLVEAYKYGAPPHGGLGMGLDRLAMILSGADSLRDVVAFPKVKDASELMSEAPANVDKESLDILGIQIKEQ